MTVKIYNWWGSSENEPPPHLKTKKQLAETGFKPLKPVGVISTRKYDLLLYDPTDATSAAPKAAISEKQKAALERGRKKQQYQAWMRESGRFIADRNNAIEWAKKVMKSPNDYAILDTETTGLYSAQIVEIGIIDANAATLLNSLVRPSIPIPAEVTRIHGIDDEAVKDAPTFPEIYPRLVEVLEGKKVIIYNADFDSRILAYCCKLHGLPSLKLKGRKICAMEWYAQFVGEWNDYYNSYKWQPLGGGHRAIADCLACLNLIEVMAAESSTDLSFETWLAQSQ